MFPNFVKRNIYALLFSVFVVFPCIGMLLDRQEPVHYTPMGTVPPTVKAGDRVSITWKVRVYRNCAGTVTRNFVDASGRVFTYTEVPLLRFDPSSDPYIVQGPDFRTPPAAVPGPMQYTGKGIFYCNFMQENLWPVKFSLPTITIMVDAPDKNKSSDTSD